MSFGCDCVSGLGGGAYCGGIGRCGCVIVAAGSMSSHGMGRRGIRAMSAEIVLRYPGKCGLCHRSMIVGELARYVSRLFGAGLVLFCRDCFTLPWDSPGAGSTNDGKMGHDDHE